MITRRMIGNTIHIRSQRQYSALGTVTSNNEKMDAIHRGGIVYAALSLSLPLLPLAPRGGGGNDIVPCTSRTMMEPMHRQGAIPLFVDSVLVQDHRLFTRMCGIE